MVIKFKTNREKDIRECCFPKTLLLKVLQEHADKVLGDISHVDKNYLGQLIGQSVNILQIINQHPK